MSTLGSSVDSFALMNEKILWNELFILKKKKYVELLFPGAGSMIENGNMSL